MKTFREFTEGGDRYKFDFDLCSVANGFAQVDTREDASYFGIWANPFTRKVVTFAEGDVTIETAETDEEFTRAIRNLEEYYGDGFKGIDPGFDDALREEFVKLHLYDLIH